MATYFPTIITRERKDGRVWGVAALEVTSVIQGELFMRHSADNSDGIPGLNRVHPTILQQNREMFARSLAGMDEKLTLELHITAIPSLIHPADSRLQMVLFICGEGGSEAETKESIVEAFLNLKSVLNSLFAEADFRPATGKKTLQEMRRYRHFKCAVSIDRKQAEIELASPFSSRQIGFGVGAGDPSLLKEGFVVNHVYQWAPSMSDWSHLVNIMLNQLDPTRIIIRLKRMTKADHALENLKTCADRCDQFITQAGPEKLTLKDQAAQIKKQTLFRIERLKESCFQMGVFLLTAGSPDSALAGILGNSITGLTPGKDSGLDWERGFQVVQRRVGQAVSTRYFPNDGEPFSAREVACAFRLPSPPFEEIPPGFPVQRFRTAMARVNVSETERSGILMAENVHRGMSKTVVMDDESRLRHCFVLGQTGTGKSTFMANMIIQDILGGKGVGVIDPHGEMIDDILGCIPRDRIKDVILVDPTDTERPIGFNMLEWKTIQERDGIIDEMVQIIDQIYDLKETGGPMFELYFRGALGLLMGDRKRQGFVPTLIDFMHFFTDSSFRRYLRETVEDPGLLDFIKQAEDVYGDVSMKNVSPYITSKLTRLQDITLKRILGQSSTAFSFDDIINNGQILLVRLGKGTFGGEIAALLANMLVSRLKMAALRRDLRDKNLKKFFLYIDEAHNLPSENIMQLLSEARKFKVGLVLATQYARQLTSQRRRSQDNLLSALLGNVGQTVTFRLGQEDAGAMGAAFEPVFGMKDIIGLPNWHAYVRMDNAATPFSIKTVLNTTPNKPDVAARVKTTSRTLYGVDSSEVDKEIFERRSVWKK